MASEVLEATAKLERTVSLKGSRWDSPQLSYIALLQIDILRLKQYQFHSINIHYYRCCSSDGGQIVSDNMLLDVDHCCNVSFKTIHERAMTAMEKQTACSPHSEI